MLHCQPSPAKPGRRIWNSSNDWAQSGRQKSAAPEAPRCQVDAQKALPGRHHRTSIAVPKMPSLTLLTERASSGAPTTSKRVAYRGHTGGIQRVKQLIGRQLRPTSHPKALHKPGAQEFLLYESSFGITWL